MLPREEWLKIAQSLPIGRSIRMLHRREGRPNLIIWNKPDAWSCYCHSCKEGGVVEKAHVRFGLESPEALKSNLNLPNDRQPQAMWDEPTVQRIGMFLASKGMDYLMLPPLWYSCTRKRLLIQNAQGWMGRDITGNALEKWLTYNQQHYLHHYIGASSTAIVEDTFSYYKMIWAVPHINVMCALGSSLRDFHIATLINQSKVFICFDGDRAGWGGAAEAVKRLRPLGIDARDSCSPDGKDPKDLSAAELNQLVKE